MRNYYYRLRSFPFDSQGATAIAYLLLGFPPLPLSAGKVNLKPITYRRSGQGLWDDSSGAAPTEWRM
jgi:hypothetical protein